MKSILQWINLLQAFSFSFADIFIMLLSMGITTRFQQFEQLFNSIAENSTNAKKSTWRILRVHYTQLLELTRFIDANISLLVLISTGHNMLTLILKIFYAFK